MILYARIMDEIFLTPQRVNWNKCMECMKSLENFCPGMSKGLILRPYGNMWHLPIMSSRDFEAFKETVLELKPDIVFVWGTIAGDAIRRGREEVYDYDTPEFHAKEGYICHLRLDGLNKEVVIINSYHPSAWAYWDQSLPLLKKYTDEIVLTK